MLTFKVKILKKGETPSSLPSLRVRYLHMSYQINDSWYPEECINDLLVVAFQLLWNNYLLGKETVGNLTDKLELDMWR